MSTRQKCKFCFISFKGNETVCPICGIDPSKSHADLTPDEKKKRNACRNIRLTGFFQILAGIFAFLSSFAFLTPLFLSPASAAKFGGSAFMLGFGLMGLGGLFFIFLGISLKRYEKWAFYFSLILYLGGVVISLLRVNVVGLFFPVLFLYCLVNPTARRIFFR